jgi:hypothetical protein
MAQCLYLCLAPLRRVRCWLGLLADSSAVIQVTTHKHWHPRQQIQHQEGLRLPAICDLTTSEWHLALLYLLAPRTVALNQAHSCAPAGGSRVAACPIVTCVHAHKDTFNTVVLPSLASYTTLFFTKGRSVWLGLDSSPAAGRRAWHDEPTSQYNVLQRAACMCKRVRQPPLLALSLHCSQR